MRRSSAFFDVTVPHAVIEEVKTNAREVFEKNLRCDRPMDWALACVYLDAFTAGARFAIDHGMVKP